MVTELRTSGRRVVPCHQDAHQLLADAQPLADGHRPVPGEGVPAGGQSLEHGPLEPHHLLKPLRLLQARCFCQPDVALTPHTAGEHLDLAWEVQDGHRRVTCRTAVEETAVMDGTEGDKAQAPPPAKIGLGIATQALGAVLQRGEALALPLERVDEQPMRRTRRDAALPEMAFIRREGGGHHPWWGRRRPLRKEGEQCSGGAPVYIPVPSPCGGTEGGTQRAWRKAIGKAQTGKPGGQQFVRLGVQVDRPELPRQAMLKQGAQPDVGAPTAGPRR